MVNHKNKKTMKELYEETMERIELFLKNGYRVIFIWESDWLYLLKK